MVRSRKLSPTDDIPAEYSDVSLLVRPDPNKPEQVTIPLPKTCGHALTLIYHLVVLGEIISDPQSTSYKESPATRPTPSTEKQRTRTLEEIRMAVFDAVTYEQKVALLRDIASQKSSAPRSTASELEIIASDVQRSLLQQLTNELKNASIPANKQNLKTYIYNELYAVGTAGPRLISHDDWSRLSAL